MSNPVYNKLENQRKGNKTQFYISFTLADIVLRW